MRPGPFSVPVLSLVAVATCLGCLPRGVERAGEGVPISPEPLVAALGEFNSGPSGVRAQGRIRLESRGSAVFGATAVAGQGMRLDAVSGAFSRPLLSLACVAEGPCRGYLPQRRRMLVDPRGTWGPWLENLIRGRLPVFGEPAGARRLVDGTTVLQLSGSDSWLQEVEFSVGGGLPGRVVFSRAGVPELELKLGGYMEVAGHPFPGEISLRPGHGAPGYSLEFRQVTTAGALDPTALQIEAPPGTEVETLEGIDTWSAKELPLWLPAPDR